MGIFPSKEFPTRRTSGVDDGQRSFGFGIRSMIRNYELLPLGFIMVGWSMMATYFVYRAFLKHDIMLNNKNRRMPYETMDTENPEWDKILIVNQRYYGNPKFERLKKIILGCASNVEDVPYVWVRPPPTDECGRPLPPPKPPAESTDEIPAEEEPPPPPEEEEPPLPPEEGEPPPFADEGFVPEEADVPLQMNEALAKGDSLEVNDNSEQLMPPIATDALLPNSPKLLSPKGSALIANEEPKRKRPNLTPVPPKTRAPGLSGSQSCGTATPVPGKIVPPPKGSPLFATSRAPASPPAEPAVKSPLTAAARVTPKPPAMSLTSPRKSATPSTKTPSRGTSPAVQSSIPASRTSSVIEQPASSKVSATRVASSLPGSTPASQKASVTQQMSSTSAVGLIKEMDQISIHSHLAHSPSEHVHSHEDYHVHEHEHEHEHRHSQEHQHSHEHLHSHEHDTTSPVYSESEHAHHSHSSLSHAEHTHSNTGAVSGIIPRTIRSDE